MEKRTTELDGRVTAGRKGIPYDWQAVLALADAAPATSTSSPADPVLVAL